MCLILYYPLHIAHLAMLVQDSYLVRNNFGVATHLTLINGCSVLVPWTLVSLPKHVNVPTSKSVRQSSALTPLEDRDYESLELIALAKRQPGVRITFAHKSYDFIVTARCTAYMKSMKELSELLYVQGLPRLSDYSRTTASHTTSFQNVHFFNSAVEQAIMELNSSTAHTFTLCTPVWNTVSATYWKGPELGEGSFGIVSLIKFKINGDLKVCKELKNNQTNFEDYWQSVVAESFAPQSIIKIKSSTSVSICTPYEFSSTLYTVTKNHYLPLAVQFSMLRDIMRDLNFLHRRGMVHSDLKSANIVCDLSGRAHIIDYGTCSMYEGPVSAVKCTFDTRAPEVLKGQITWLAADVWSLGVIALNLSARHKLVNFGDGVWTNGKKWNWKTEETLICLKQISKLDLSSMGNFLRSVNAHTISLGMAVLLSQCLHPVPGERNALGLCHYSQPVSMFHWPFPYSAIFKTTPPIPSTFSEISESHLGIHTLDGSLYDSSSDVPEPQGRKMAVRAERTDQLRYIVLLLSALNMLTPKLFILTLDFLDRLGIAPTDVFAHRLWENACIVLASMVGEFSNVSCAKVCEESHKLVSSSLNVKQLEATVFRVLGSLQFKLLREDNIWEISGAQTQDSAYVNGLLHGFMTWPDAKLSVWDFLESIKKTSEVPSWFCGTFQKSDIVLTEEWNTKKVEDEVLKPLGIMEETPKQKFARTPNPVDTYLAQFLAAKIHPMFISLPPCINSMSLADVQDAVQHYVELCCTHVTPAMIQLESCISCGKDATLSCSNCDSWALCQSCRNDYEVCPQCIKSEEKISFWRANH